MNNEPKRLFTALRFDEETIDCIAGIEDFLKEVDPNARFVSPVSNFHITLYFIGTTQKLERVETGFNRACELYREEINRPVDVTFEQVNMFIRRSGNILYLGVRGNDEMRWLAETIPDELEKEGIEVKRGRFTPHITLARKFKGRIPGGIILPPSVRIKEAALVWSHRDNNNILVYDNIIKHALTT